MIIVPAYEELVQITGNVNDPRRYEIKAKPFLPLLKYAADLPATPIPRALRIVRQNGKEYQVNTGLPLQRMPAALCDVITAEAILDRFTNKLELRGAVYRPASTSGRGPNTVRELVEKADD